MPETTSSELTEREQHLLVTVVVAGVAALVLTTGTFVLLFVFRAPWWALSAPLVIMGILASVGTFVFLRRIGVSRGEAGLWGAIVASPLGDLIWFMKDPSRTEARDRDLEGHDDLD